MFLLGFDIGSSSVKGAIVDAGTKEPIAFSQYPETEMKIDSPQPGWAEQSPELWWDCLCRVSKKLIAVSGIDVQDIKAIGIAYQMHGLVVIDANQKVVRPSIIWCDSRAVGIGDEAFDQIGHDLCLRHMLNSPGNFTASKLKWVQDHEPERYERIHKMMLPGDYIAMRMTGMVTTTATGLSEGMLWDFERNSSADLILDHYGISTTLLPEVVSNFSTQGELSITAAEELGLTEGIPVTFRAGDQPNNALALGVLNPGEVAATGGTSGVIYGVTDKVAGDVKSRVNSFAHVNHTAEDPRIGILLCINGTGIQYAWLKRNMAPVPETYREMERLASEVPVGSDGLKIYPFGNGAERVLGNIDAGASVHNLHFNRHGQGHMFRAALEGIAFAFGYGFEVMKELGVDTSVIRVGNDNLFQSEVFSEAVASVTGCRIDLHETTGAVGAALASGFGINIYSSLEEGVARLEPVQQYEPIRDDRYSDAYQQWKAGLSRYLNRTTSL